MNAPARLKLNGPADLITAVPYLLGFEPDHSLVVIGLKNHELQCTFRVDLPGSIDHLDHLPSLTGQAETNGCDKVVLLTYGKAEIATACMERVALEFDIRGIDILDRFRITDDRYYNIGCTKTCCPPEGWPLHERPDIAAELVAAGALKRPDRESIDQLFTPTPADQRAAVAHAIEDALHTEAELSWAEQRKRDLTAIDHWLEAGTLPERAEDIATLGLALGDLDIRDYTLRQSDHHRATGLDLWLWVPRHLEEDLVAPALTVAGWCAYRTGNGVVALEAFELALKFAPHYRLARMLHDTLQAGIPPHALDAITAVRTDA